MLKLQNVTLGYGKKPVLHMDSLMLAEGGKCLITGVSGSGKTTLLYAIAGLIPVMSGSIAIAGKNITSMNEGQRDHFRGKHIGIIFQTLHLVRSLTVLDNLMLAYFAAGMKPNKERARHMLHRLGIEDKKDTLPERLSQGQAQRVAIARAVLHRPPLILADEPTSSLDDKSCTKVIEIIMEIAKEAGSALLVSTHDSRIKPHFDQVIHCMGDK
jgi:putative ABC transport system ATP-binding protein